MSSARKFARDGRDGHSGFRSDTGAPGSWTRGFTRRRRPVLGPLAAVSATSGQSPRNASGPFKPGCAGGACALPDLGCAASEGLWSSPESRCHVPRTLRCSPLFGIGCGRDIGKVAASACVAILSRWVKRQQGIAICDRKACVSISGTQN